MTDREAFEVWAKSFYKEQKMSLNSDVHFSRPNEYMLNHYQSAWEAWQAATLAERERCIEIVGLYKVPVGNSSAGELACEWTMDAIKEIYEAIRGE
jgi:hypothetical protein